MDYGRKRIGLALSDPLGMMAHGLETYHRKSLRKDVAYLVGLLHESEAQQLLVGNPLLMDGSESEMSQEAREFAERVATRAGVPYVMWDERMSSREADRYLQGLTREQKMGHTDRIAAEILLNHYLSMHSA